MDGDTFDRVAIVGIAFILGGIAAMALGHLAGRLIVIGVGALILGLGRGERGIGRRAFRVRGARPKRDHPSGRGVPARREGAPACAERLQAARSSGDDNEREGPLVVWPRPPLTQGNEESPAASNDYCYGYGVAGCSRGGQLESSS